MNHCRKCDSDYEQPGTCNCFAEEGAVVVHHHYHHHSHPLPYNNYPYQYPIHPVPIYPWYGDMTITCDPVTYGSQTITNTDGEVTTNSVPLVNNQNFGPMVIEAARQAVEYDETH